jgi:hypothetical protein
MQITPIMQSFFNRLLFAALSAAILVVFSEKVYWYIQGYGFLELLLYYFFPTYVFLWAIEAFRVRRWAPLFLAAALYGFLVEGVLTPVLYEDGLLGLFHVSYTSLAWHALVSVLFGWYWLRRLLIQGDDRRIMLWSAVFGLFWGLWSLAYWLPENLDDAELLAEGFILGKWPVGAFAIYALLFTAALAISHLALARGYWQASFKPSRYEIGAAWLAIIAYFIVEVVLAVPFAPVKLGALLALVFLPLWMNRQREPAGSLLAELAKPVAEKKVVLLFVMPLAAIVVYGLAFFLQPDENTLRLMSALPLVWIPTIVGGILFLAAIFSTWRAARD